VDFLTGKSSAVDVNTWLPLLDAGLIKPNSCKPPLFVRTELGDSWLRKNTPEKVGFSPTESEFS
jgi:hypothetical protein